MKKRKTLRQYLSLPVFLVVMIPISLFAIISVLHLRSTINEDLGEHISNNLEKADRSLDLVLDKYNTILYNLCTDEEIVELLEDINDQKNDPDTSKSKLHRELNQICNRNRGVTGITIFMGNGEIIFYDRLSASFESSSWASKVELPRMQTGEVYIGMTKPVQVEGEEKYMFRIARKVIDYQNVQEKIGSIVLSMDENVLSDTLKSGHDTEVYLFNKDGMVISASDQDKIGLEKSMLDTGKDPYATVTNGTSGWTVCNQQLMDTYHETLSSQVLFMILVTIAVILVLIVIIYWMSRPLVRGVNHMVQSMNRVEQGDFSTRINVAAGLPEEAEQIANGFNNMVAHMDSLISQVKNAVVEQKNAELAALEAQIDPHFLYNTLDTINWKAIEKEEYEISEMVGALADILRYTIRNTNSETSIEQELYWLDQYILLQSKKLGKPLETVVKVPESLKLYKIHKLLLQPFVENAIKHGLRKIKRPCVLTISMNESDEQIHICVKDNGKGMDKETLKWLNDPNAQNAGHLGVENVRKRLKLYYGEEANIYFESEPDKYTEVHLFIPKERRGVER